MKVLKYITYQTIIIAVMTLYSCSNDEYQTTGTDKPVAIRFSGVSVNDNTVSVTRATGADAHNEGLPIGSDIDVFIYDSSGNAVYEYDEDADTSPSVTLPMVYTTIDEPDAETAKSNLNIKDSSLKPPRYPNGNPGTAYIFAVWPAMPSSSEASADSYTFSVAADQRDASAVASSDLLATDQIQQLSTGGKAIDLPMTHCMAKVIVRFNPTGNLTASNMPATFDMLGIKNSVTIKPKTAATAVSGNGRDAITTNSGTTTIQCTAGQAFLIPPQTIAQSTKLLEFNIGGTASDNFSAISGASFTTTNAITFVANMVYEITINVNVNYITATATITPWNTEDMTFDKYIL